MWQNTIQKAVTVSGTGLHTGKKTTLRILPAPCGNHIVFIRTDIPGKPCVKASIENLSQHMRCTALVQNKIQVHTTEHLLATCFAMNLDNLIIEIDGPEVPGMDGSALPFYDALKQAGIQEQNEKAEEILITEEILLEKKDSALWRFLFNLLKIGGKRDSSSIQALPSPSLKLEYFLDYSLPYIPSQHIQFEISEDTFAREIAPARTFALAREIGLGQKILGLGKGANPQNTLFISDKGNIIDNSLRFPDELARHKLLDLLGDMALIGNRLKSHIIARRSGHAMNGLLAKKISARVR